MTCKRAAEVGESYFRRFFFFPQFTAFLFFLWSFAVFYSPFPTFKGSFCSVFSDFRLFSADFSLFVYASEADVLNVALFGMTAKEW